MIKGAGTGKVEEMTKQLFIQAIGKFLCGIVVIGALLFGSAGTFGYMNGWIFIALLFGPMFVAGVIMMVKNPGLLKKG